MSFINLLEIIYPVGSLYFSTLNTSPSSVVGGTWTRVSGAAIRASSSMGYTGSDSHEITIDEMPSHTHDLKGYGAVLGSGSIGWRFGAGGSETATGIVFPTGGGEAMSRIQRSFNCCIWYRTA